MSRLRGTAIADIHRRTVDDRFQIQDVSCQQGSITYDRSVSKFGPRYVMVTKKLTCLSSGLL
jgi:hypothetical protein